MQKIYNFGAGPAMLPQEVLQQAQAEMLNWNNTGVSVMELGHRGPEFKQVAEQSEANLRLLLNIPNNYRVLFLSGGATTQFAMVPLNLFARHKVADYIDTGIWSKHALAEAKRYGQVNVAAEACYEENLLTIPDQTEWKLNPHAAYVHYTANETIEGIEFQAPPKTGDVPLVVDMTSNILSRPINVSDYGIIYAGAQKNIGQSGITVVIIREDLIKEPLPGTPTLYSYKVQSENKSFYNTPPTYAWYMAGLVFAWMLRHGGVPAFAELNRRKAKKLYTFIDSHLDFYRNPVHPSVRSLMNVPFYLRNESLTPAFLKTAEEAGLLHLRGHRLAGGVRASIYNAMPEAGVDLLIEVMRDFAQKNG